MAPRRNPLIARKRAGKIPNAIPEIIEIKTFILLFKKMKINICQSFKEFMKSVKGIMSAIIFSEIKESFVEAEYPAKAKKINIYPDRNTYFLILEKKSFIVMKNKADNL